MARNTEALVLELTADLRRAEQNMAKMVNIADKRLTQVERRAMQSDKNLSRIMGNAGRNMTESFRNGLRGIAPVLAGAFSAQAVIAYADSYTALQNRLKASGLEGERLVKVENELYDIANRNNVAIEASVELYQRAAGARENLGASEEELLRIVSGTAASLRLQGTSTTQASGALLQFGQLLGGTMVQAQEYNSLIDQMPVLLQAVASGSDRWGGSVNKLTKDVKSGKVTTQEFAQAALKGFEDVEKKAGEAAVGVGSALQTLNNQLGRFIGQTDSSLSATERMAQAILYLADNLEIVVSVGGVLAAMMGGRVVVAIGAAAKATQLYKDATFAAAAASAGAATRAGAASFAFQSLGKSIVGAFGGPVGIAITAVAIAISFVASEAAKGSQAMRDIKAASEAADKALTAYEKAARKAAEASGEGAEASRQNAERMREEALAAIDAARANAKLAEARVIAAQAALAERQDDFYKAGTRSQNYGVPGGAIALAESRLQSYQKEVDAAREALSGLEDEFDAIEQRLKSPSRISSPSGGGSGTSSKAARDRQAEMRQRLENERRLAEIRATGDAKAIQAEEDRQRLAELTASYTEAGYENAAELAKEVMGYEIRIRDLAKEREEIEKRREAYIDRTGKLLDRFEGRQNAIADFAREELRHRQEIARLTGDKAGEESARRELMLVEQIARYRSIGMNTADATAAANRRVDEIISAEKRGELRDTFAKSFSEGIRAIAAGDIQSFAANMAGSFAEQALQNLGEKFFDAIFGTSENIQTGTEIGLAQNSVLTPALVAASATMAATLSAAITTAGATAAAAIGAAMGSAGAVSAFSSLPSFAGGGYTGNAPRSGGLDGKGGFLAMMHPRERVNDLTRGMPSPSSLTGSRGAMEVKQNFTINAQGSILASDIVKEIHRVGAQAISVAVDRSGRNMRKSLPSAMSKLDRYGTP